MAQMGGVVGSRVELVVGGLVDVEAPRTGRDVEAFVLHGDDVEVHEVAVELARAWRRVPGRCRQDFDSCRRFLVFVVDAGLKGEERAFFGAGHDVVGRRAVDAVRARLFLF